LQVIARTSSFYFNGKSEKITTIARELGVRYVLEGSVRKAGNTLRVTAQLIRADTGVHLWSDSYDRNLKDMFKVQDEIAASVVHALKATLLTQVSRAKRDAANIDSYTLMLQARFLIGRGSEADVQQSIVLLERALALDAAYAPAWIELSRAHAFFAGQVDSTPGANIAQARAAAQKALALDPTSADAHAALGDIQLNYDLDARGAAAEFDAARRADPGTPRPDLLSLYFRVHRRSLLRCAYHGLFARRQPQPAEC
jgi:tetratricopeptide (TPR) repeat protein